MALLDAPVSGGVRRAIDGSLCIMVGGAAADLERARPAFAAMGKTITLCGPAGAGHTMKALNNYLSAAGLVAMCEALVVGEAFGLDPGTMVDVFNTSTGKSNATEVKGRQFVVSRTFAAGFTTGLMAKDLRTAGEVAEHLKLNMPMLKRAVAYWGDANGKLAAPPITPRSSATPRCWPRRNMSWGSAPYRSVRQESHSPHRGRPTRGGPDRADWIGSAMATAPSGA